MKTQEQANACIEELEAVLLRHGFILSPESQCGLVICDRDELTERDCEVYNLDADLVNRSSLP